MRRRLILAAIASVAITDAAMAGAEQGQDKITKTGPSTTTEPYLVPTTEGVATVSILTTGDSIGGYRLVGIPDGMGAFYDLGDGQTQGPDAHHAGPNRFHIVLHHELGRTVGVTRSHGSKGAFVSRWIIERDTLKVISGRDQINSPNDLFTWNGSGYVPGTTAFERFCSADLAGTDAYRFRQFGTHERIFLGGEETSPPFTGDYGRAWAHVVTGPNTGKTYELPRLGKHSFENAVASPFAQKKTIVMLDDDANAATNVTPATVCRAAGQTGCAAPGSELFMYVGTKQSTGNEIERAGLTNGKLFGLRVKVGGAVVTGENLDFVFSSTAPAVTSAQAEFVDLGDVSGKTGQQIEDDALAAQVTQFMRIEDGAWDPRPGKQNDYYFVTTGAISATQATWRPSRLWHVHFKDIANPEAGGTIEMLLTNQFFAGAGTTPDDDPTFQMFDNMAIDGLGRIVLLEDVGNNARRGRIYVYGIDNRKLEQVAVHNPKFFQPGSPDFITQDEEASGVIDASNFLGAGWFLTTVQNHRPSSDAELVEGGQLLAVFIDPSIGR
ncbi:MAG: phytase [Hyphomicrobiaceae bacterium]|nr:phytase [Hyphomicrobiaceae bacterium]